MELFSLGPKKAKLQNRHRACGFDGSGYPLTTFFDVLIGLGGPLLRLALVAMPGGSLGLWMDAWLLNSSTAIFCPGTATKNEAKNDAARVMR